MTNQLKKVKKYLDILAQNRWKKIEHINDLAVCPCGYKTGNTPPALEEFKPAKYGDVWGQGIDTHAWFHFTVDELDENTYLGIQTDKNGWDANNPQFIIYANGIQKQK